MGKLALVIQLGGNHVGVGHRALGESFHADGLVLGLGLPCLGGCKLRCQAGDLPLCGGDVGEVGFQRGLQCPLLVFGGGVREAGVVSDERGERLALFDRIAGQHMDFLHHPVDQCGGFDRQRCGFDPTAGLKQRHAVGGR